VKRKYALRGKDKGTLLIHCTIKSSST